VVNIAGGKQVENITLARKISRGTYFVKVVDANRQLAFSERVVLQ